MPRLAQRPEDCLACGYPLDGIPAPGACPECGCGFDDGYSVIEFSGVARRDSQPVWRRGVWILLAAGAFLLAQIVGILIIKGMVWVALLVLAAIIAGTMGMALTARQKSTGSERFSITPNGMGRAVIGQRDDACRFIAFDAPPPTAQIERIGQYWARIKLQRIQPNDKPQILLDAGFRCPSEDLLVLEQLIERQLNGQGLGDPTEIPGFVHSVLDTKNERI